MKLSQELRLPQLMGLITDMAPKAHIRLALAPDRTSPTTNPDWVARSFVIDVYPANWLDRWNQRKEGPLSDCVPPAENHNYPGRALFCLGYLPTESIAKWFAHPEDCQLYGFDARDGFDSLRRGFHLPELQDLAFGYQVFSGQNDQFARLPWPHFNYDYNLKGPNFSDNCDQQTLYAPNEPHFDDFREARGRLIHNLTDLRNYQDRDKVMIRIVDGDGWIRQAHLKGRKLKVTVEGRKLYPVQVIIKGTGLYDGPDNKRDVLVAGPVDFTLNSDPPPDLRVILANAESGELDKVWRSLYSGPLDTSSPHFIVEEEDEPDEPSTPPAGGVATDRSMTQTVEQRTETNQNHKSALARPPAKRELRVVVVSPGDVKKERQSIRGVLDELNEGVAGQLGLHLTPWLWETDAYPGFHVEGPQRQIDDQMRIEDAAIVLGIFWTRIGTRTPDGKSGTEHELLKASEAWEKHGHPQILVYFNERAYSPKNKEVVDQWSAVYAFKDQLKSKGLLGTYQSSSRFPDVIRRALQRLLLDHYPQGSDLP